MKRNLYKLFVAGVLSLFGSTIHAQIYVDQNATAGVNDGSSWADAYIDLQSAMDAASTNDSIWVAEGTYYPAQEPDGAPATTRFFAFHSAGKDVAIYGGFEGTETSIGQRDIVNHPTVLSGDFNDDDVVTGTGSILNFADTSDNAYHAIVLAEVDIATFNGITISGGNGSSQNNNYVYGGRTISSLNGGGISSSSSSPSLITLVYCSVNKNIAGVGGGIFFTSAESSVILKNTRINKNKAGNASGANGGGVFTSSVTGSSSVKLNNSIISGNSTEDYGGGVYSLSPISSSVSIDSSTVSGNSAGEYGGGLYSGSYSASSVASSITIDNSTINNNTSSKNGGGVYCYSAEGTSTVALENSTFNDNTANNGGAIYSFSPISPSSVEVTNSTITGNSASISGGGIFSSSSSSFIEVTSSIIWTASGDGLNIEYDGLPSTFTSNGYNIFSDAPLGSIASDSINVSNMSLNLLPLAFNGGTTQTMLPDVGSIAINGGSSDLSDAQNRIIVGRRDIGAAEYFCAALGGTDVQTACGSFVWIDGITYTADNSVATHIKINNIDGACDTLFTLDLTINPAVDITTTQSGIVLTANASAATYQWLDCDNANAPIAGATNQTFTATANGNYAVEVTQNGCSDTSTCIAVTTVGLNKYELAGVSIYPNPTNGEVTVSFNNMQEAQHTLEVLDATGRVLNSQKINNNSTLVNLSNYGRGLYLIRISNGKNQSVHRVIKK